MLGGDERSPRPAPAPPPARSRPTRAAPSAASRARTPRLATIPARRRRPVRAADDVERRADRLPRPDRHDPDLLVRRRLAGSGAAKLRDQIVVVGATAPALQDVHPTSAPGERQLPGAEIQANAIWTALNGNPLRPIPDWRGVRDRRGARRPGAVARAARSGPCAAACSPSVLGALYLVGAQLAFNGGAVLPVAVPLVALAFALALSLLARAVDRAVRPHASRPLQRRARGRRARAHQGPRRDPARGRAPARPGRRAARRRHRRAHRPHEPHVRRRRARARPPGDPRRARIRYAAVLHDVGKIGVPDSILRKPGRLTTRRWR